MQGEKDKERAAQVVADFKVVFDRWYQKSRKLREIQTDISKIIYNPSLSHDQKFDCILLVIFALPKGLRHYQSFEMLMDVKFFINTYKECRDGLGADTDQVRDAMAGGNILFMFRENFATLCALQSLADDEHDEKLDDSVIHVAGEAQRSYKAHLKRDARKQMADDEHDEDDDDDGDDQDDDDDEDEPA